jgi:hypothetical protein
MTQFQGNARQGGEVPGPRKEAGPGARDQSRSSSLMPVLERVFSSTRFTITAQ